MSSNDPAAKRFNPVDLIPGGLLLLAIIGWTLFAFLIEHDSKLPPPNHRFFVQVLLLFSLATWLTTAIWLDFLNKRKNARVSRKLILLCILYPFLLPILYAVVLLKKPGFENKVANKEIFERLWKKRLSRFDGRRIRAELALKNHTWGAEVIEPLVGAIKGNERLARELLGKVVDKNAIPKLLGLLQHENSDVRESASAALARIGNGPDNNAAMELFSNIVAVLAEGRASTRWAIELLATLEGHRNRSRVLALAAHRRAAVRHVAVSTLHRMWKQRPNDAGHSQGNRTLIPRKTGQNIFQSSRFPASTQPFATNVVF